MLKSLTLGVCLAGVSLVAQENPLSASIKGAYTMGKNNILKAAEEMPEDNYSFKPTPDIRSFGQLIGHVADAQYLFCTAVSGEKSPATKSAEKMDTTKAALVEDLKAAFAYCDKVYGDMTDAKAAEMVKFFGRENPKLGVLSFNNMHNYEHYGNIVTYLRLKSLVPPSSQPKPKS
jgi:uncharacterized damage-inducible protein DinB